MSRQRQQLYIVHDAMYDAIYCILYIMLQVQDLHAVTPASFLEASGSVIHSLSYQQARNSRMAVGQVYLAEAGYLMGQAGHLPCCVCMRISAHLGGFAEVQEMQFLCTLDSRLYACTAYSMCSSCCCCSKDTQYNPTSLTQG